MPKEMTKSKRNGQYELIRVVAMLFVIGVHVVENLPVDTPRRVFYNSFFSLLFYTCNGLFFMLSGKFALEGSYQSKEDRKVYFQKRLTNLVLPMIFFMWLRSAYSVKGDIFNLEFWSLCIRNILCDYAGKDYWFLYILMGNLLIAPFLSKAFVRADKSELKFFVGMGVIYSGLCVYLPYIGFSMEWRYLFAEWSFYFYLGYCLERIVDERKENLIIALGAVSFLLSLWQIYHGYEHGIYNVAPTYILITCAMWFVVKRLYQSRWEIINKAILFLGKHSFAVYMVHMKVKDKMLECIPFTGRYLGYLILMTIVVAIVSLIIGVILDVTIIALLKRLTQKRLFSAVAQRQ